MSLASALAFLASNAPDIRVIDLQGSPMDMGHIIASGGMAKSLLLNIGSVRAMIVIRHDMRLDNQKCRQTFSVRPKMLAANVVEMSTGHAIDAVSPIGMICKVPIYFDLSLRHFEDIYVPVGSSANILKIPVDRLANLVSALWVDVSRPSHTAGEKIAAPYHDYILA
jgi:prolyl-tRNA editing enzyme YbaK/EbsC (Cys-tRNA(Pro) deacylase)